MATVCIEGEDILALQIGQKDAPSLSLDCLIFNWGIGLNIGVLLRPSLES